MAFIDVLEQFRNYLKGILDSSNERENEAETIDNIRKGINFKGSNLWVLIFAIFIASLGLNVNSTAVIIGAIKSRNIPFHPGASGRQPGSITMEEKRVPG